MQILEFDSSRKRMSLILRDTTKTKARENKYILFCKGADSAIYRSCISGDLQSAESCIKQFAHNGWRTLALAYRELNQEEYETYAKLLLNAYNDITNRSGRMAAAFDEIESKLTLIGTTGIEDKLQEGVSDTLEALRFAGIKIWVLTGDKVETAVNISQSCGHFTDEMEKLMLTTNISSETTKIENKLQYFLEWY
jgi:phospholipid-translocating ATPase